MRDYLISTEALEARRDFYQAAQQAITALKDFQKQWDSSIKICEEAILKSA